MKAVGVATLLLLLSAGCPGPEVKDCAIQCSAAVGCPSGLSCMDGYCRTGSAELACAALLDGAVVPDALIPEPDATPCVKPDDSVPFGEAKLIDVLSDPAIDDDPSLTGDLRELYFKSTRAGGFDIWVSRRDSVDDPWGDPEPVVELNTDGEDNTPEVSFDGLTMMLASDRLTSPDRQLFVSTRDGRDDDWSDPEPVDDLNSDVDDYSATRDEAESVVVFNRPVMGQLTDLFGAKREGGGWTAPVPLANLSTTAFESDASLDREGREIYFTADLADGQLREIYRSRRATTAADFDVPAHVVELATDMNDEDPWVSPCGDLIFFSSDRSGDQEIYWAER